MCKDQATKIKGKVSPKNSDQLNKDLKQKAKVLESNKTVQK